VLAEFEPGRAPGWEFFLDDDELRRLSAGALDQLGEGILPAAAAGAMVHCVVERA
jgi:hypothetical protein